MAFPVALAIAVGVRVVGYLWRKWEDHEAGRGKDKPDYVINLPRVGDNEAIGLAYGRVLIKNPMLIWVGHMKCEPGYQGGPMQYSAALQFALALSNTNIDDDEAGPARLMPHGLWFNEVPVETWREDLPAVSAHLSSYTYRLVIGDEEMEACYVQVNSGAWDSVIPAGNSTTRFVFELAGIDVDNDMPPYRGVVTALVAGPTGPARFGSNPNIPPVAFEGVFPVGIPGVNPSFMEIGDGDANPAGVLYDLLCNNSGGRLGIDPALVDTTNFGNVALVLWIEQNGFSYYQFREAPIRQLFEMVLKQIDGYCHIHPQTGLWTITLVREDYDVGTIDVYNENNILEVLSFEQSGWPDTINTVRCNYTARYAQTSDEPGAPATLQLAYATKTAMVQNSASAGAVGVTKPMDADYPGVSNADLASIIAARDLRAHSLPFSRARLRVSRDAFYAHAGQVISVTHPRWGGATIIMRVLRADIGDDQNNSVTLELVQDKWAVGEAIWVPPPSVAPQVFLPDTVTSQWVGEVPRFILYRAIQGGLGSSVDTPRGMYLAGQPNDNDAYQVSDSLDADATSFVDATFVRYFGTFEVDASYARNLEPYDTGTGLRIRAVVGWTPTNVAATSRISALGHNLLLVGEELLAFETVTDLGGGDYLLNNVWRGLADTVPVAHAVGEVGYYLDPGQIATALGVRGFELSNLVRARLLGVRDGNVQAATDASYTDFTVRKRTLLPLPVADLLAGSQDETPIKAPSNLYTEGVDLTWRKRERVTAELVRGDAASETLLDAVTFSVIAAKGEEPEATLRSGITDAYADDVSLAAGGYGNMTLYVRATYTLLGNAMTSWQDPGLPILAYEWRNLLVNPYFTGNLFSWWTAVSGGTDFEDGPFSGAPALRGATGGAGQARQEATVTGYHPSRMKVDLSFLVKQVVADADDTLTVTLKTLNSASSVQDTATYGPSIPTTDWVRQTLTISNAATTTDKLRVDATFTPVGGGDTQGDAGLAGFRLRLGQFSSQLLTNGSFESGAGSWTTTAGGFTTPASNPLEGAQRLLSDDNAANTAYQEVAVPAGYNFGYAVVEFGYRMESSVGTNTVTVTVEARSSGGTVLASMINGPIAPADRITWYKDTAWCAVPDGTANIRVTLTATRLSATNTISFDDVELFIHKYLDPQVETEYLLAPPVQELPSTEREWLDTYTTVAAPDYGLFDGARGRLGTEPELVAETGAYIGSKLTGLASAAGVVHPAFEVRGTGAVRARSNVTFGNFSTEDEFTVRVVFDCHSASLDSGKTGLVGRLGTTGWGLYMTEDGFVEGTLVGATATKTVTRSSAANRDGGVTWAALSYNPTTDVLRVMDRFGEGTLSTAGMGEISCAEIVNFYIGAVAELDAGVVNTMTGLIGSVEIWQEALTYAQLSPLWTHGTNTALGGSAAGVASGTVACIVGEDADGIVVGRYSTGMVPHAYDTTQQRRGLGCASARVNMTAADPNTATGWTTSGATVTLSAAVGPQGVHDAVQITGTNAQYRELTISTNLVGASPNVNLVFPIRGSAAGNAQVSLVETDGTILQTVTVPVTTLWSMARVRFTTWVGGTTQGRVRFYASNSGSSATVFVAGPVFIDQNADAPFPSLLHIGGTSAACYDSITAAPGVQFNHEGEVVVDCTTHNASPTTGIVINLLETGSSNDDRRCLFVGSASGAGMLHYDGAAVVDSNALTSAISWNGPVLLRGRWNRAGLLDAASAFSRLMASTDDGGTYVTDIGRAVIWTPDTAAITRLQLGHAQGTDILNGIIFEVTLRAREKIL